MPRIFVCYRREDTFHATGRLGDRLRAQYGANNVFVDVTSNEAGVEYQRTTLAALRASDVVLVVIGDRWLGGRGFFRRRGGIRSPQSLARVEIEAALQARIPIVPVLVDGARMPGLNELPRSIAGLAGIHARRLDAGEDFDHHTRRLIERIDAVVAKPSIALGSMDERPAQQQPPFVVSPPPPGSPWEFPVASQSRPDGSGPRVAAPDSKSPATDKKSRLRIAGATAVLALPVMMFSEILLFLVTGWQFIGAYGVPNWIFFKSLAITSGVILLFIAFRCRRWTSVDRLELASYWVAAIVPVISVSFFLFISTSPTPPIGLGISVGGCILLAPGLFFLARHWNDWTERELPIYWGGCSAISLLVISDVSSSYLPEHSTKMLLLACLLELYMGGVLVWWRRKALTPHDYVIFWIGMMLVGGTMSNLISSLISGPTWPNHGLVAWGAVAALSFVYIGVVWGHRLLLWERMLGGVVATGFVCLGIGLTWGLVAGVVCLGVALLPILLNKVGKTAKVGTNT